MPFVNTSFFRINNNIPINTITKINCSKKMIKIHNQHKSNVIASKKVDKKDVSRWGIFKMKKINKRNFLIKDVVEKPSIKSAPSNFAIIAALFPGSKYNLLGSGVTLPKTCLKGSTISPSKSTIKVLVPLFFTLNLYLIILSNGSKTKGKGSKFISKVSMPDIFFP